MPIRLACLCVLSVVLSTNAFAQEAPVTDCDKYAASDRDPQRNVQGIPFHRLNPAPAIPACEEAVRQFPKNARLVFQLGRAYLKANNFAAAAAQFRIAGEQNHALAQFNLGYLYENGRGVAKDDQQAVLWLRKAADQGVAQAQFNLGMMYKDGRGVRKDEREAVAWLLKAADQNDAMAQFNLAAMYSNGLGVARDYQQGMAWFRKAADQGLAVAQISLGVMYARGQGVPKDEQQAIFWYRKAADQGNIQAQVMIEEIENPQRANRGR